MAALVEGESARIGEKLVLSRFAAFEGTTATYLHKATDLPPAIGVAVQYSGGAEEAVRSLAMHIAAARPRFLTREEVPAETVETERRVAEQTAKEEAEQAIVKIVEGRQLLLQGLRPARAAVDHRAQAHGEAGRRRRRPDRGAVRPLRGRPGLNQAQLTNGPGLVPGAGPFARRGRIHHRTRARG